jgi:transcriptional regulator with XRE-family HTH domain
MSHYKTITGRKIDLHDLSSEERCLLSVLFKEHRKQPDWVEFSRSWQKLLGKALSRLPPVHRPRHPLYRIAQDLEMRLGIAQSTVAEPDYRDYLVDRIEEKYGSRYRFCKETGIPEPFLSQVLSGKKDFSIEMLRRAAKALDLVLALLPRGELADT